MSNVVQLFVSGDIVPLTGVSATGSATMHVAIPSSKAGLEVPRETERLIMDVKQFREDIVRPALKMVDLWSKSAENLIVGTALVESSLEYVKQLGNGPALSFCQVEPATYADCLRYLKLPNNKKLKDNILTSLYMDVLPIDANALIWNIRLSVLICRIKYYMRPEKLPEYDDAMGLAQYHLRWYNAGGATDITKSVKIFEGVCKYDYT